jgi:hypothetical protein
MLAGQQGGKKAIDSLVSDWFWSHDMALLTISLREKQKSERNFKTYLCSYLLLQNLEENG